MKLKKLYKRAEKNDITLLIFRKRIALYLKIVHVKKVKNSARNKSKNARKNVSLIFLDGFSQKIWVYEFNFQNFVRAKNIFTDTLRVYCIFFTCTFDFNGLKFKILHC